LTGQIDRRPAIRKENKMKRKLISFLCMGLLLFLPASSAMATVVTSQAQPVAISLNVSESITLSCTPASITMTYNTNGTATASGPIACTTAWNLANGHTGRGLFAWFSDPNAGLTSALGSIPTSEIFASVNGGSSLACNQTPNQIPSGGVIGAFCGTGTGQISNLQNIGTNPQTDTILLSMQGLGTLPPANFTGTLNFFAEAF
jgi:hypothetical protein